ncbi:unnamed protein product [Cuscuta europaea]|nr:unnamed protein product [Cuscuta europaea]
MERLSPSGCPDEIKDLVGREFVFKVDRQSGSPLNGKSYSIGMVSTDQDKIEELKSVGANQSGRQDYNSDEDLDLLFSSPVTVESNISLKMKKCLMTQLMLTWVNLKIMMTMLNTCVFKHKHMWILEMLLMSASIVEPYSGMLKG